MSGKDSKKKKLHAYNIKTTNTIRANLATKAIPSKHAEECFRAKPYQLREKGQENEKGKKTNANGKTEGHEQH